jgi:hypothetical protein
MAKIDTWLADASPNEIRFAAVCQPAKLVLDHLIGGPYKLILARKREQQRSRQKDNQAEDQEIKRNSPCQRRLPERAITFKMVDNFHASVCPALFERG